MFEEFEVKPLFEDQVHERHQFSLNIDGNMYQGIFHDEEINWFHPQPKLEEKELKAVESKVYDLMTNDNVEEFDDFEIKPLFEDQVHERHHFTLNINGHTHQGIYHDEEIHWFHPHPTNKLEEEKLEEVESKVHTIMTNRGDGDIDNLEIKPLFEDQVHERHHFTVNIEGHDHQGIYHEEEINWFHPHPENKLEEKKLEKVESKVTNIMKKQSK